jgi:hypothetical protein
VREFVEFMVKFIPSETEIVSTSKVVNKFDKKAIILSETHEYDGIPDNQLDIVQQVRKELDKMFDKNKDPDPLFVLDLILKPN